MRVGGGPKWFHTEGLKFTIPKIYKSWVVNGAGTNKLIPYQTQFVTQMLFSNTKQSLPDQYICHSVAMGSLDMWSKFIIMQCLNFRMHRNIYKQYTVHKCGEQQHSWYSDLLQDGKYGVWILVGATFSTHIQNSPGIPPASCTNGTSSFHDGKVARQNVSYEAPITQNGLCQYRNMHKHYYIPVLQTW
jgi:hypothetical protein